MQLDTAQKKVLKTGGMGIGNKPCPVCCSTDLTENLWSVRDAEVPAIECNECLCGAPKSSWNSDRCWKRMELQRRLELKVA